ncbi:MAG TPA: hypothetical protein VIF14_16050 [Alphaproteobacteria bacterium]|jgi:hypothetical protein
MLRLPALRRGIAAAIVVLSLAACASTAQNGAATTAAPSKDQLVALNDTFRAAYRDLRDWRTSTLDPIIIVQFDDLHLVRRGKTRTATFTPPIYHQYKAIAHIPLALYVKLALHVGRPFDKETLAWLTAYMKQVQAAGASLDGRPGWTPEQLRLHKKIVAESLKFMETIGGAEQVSDDQLTAYTRAMRPLVLASADAAARAQLDGLHALVNKWRSELGPHWSHVDVVVLGPKQPRPGNAQYEYFVRAMGCGAVGKRLWYAEGVFDKDGGVNLLGTILVDRGASIAFFNDPVRLERDLLADAAQRHLNRLFPRR